MKQAWSRCGIVLILLPALLPLNGCATRAEAAPRQVEGVAYGTTREPFHERWWQYCERGVSFANGGFWSEAESDLRQSLALRRTDARRARTYGMHFVQCFAHRELGGVLIAQGRLDEAQAELELSLAQEPSAKAEYLLRRIRQLRGQEAAPAPAAGPVVIDPAVAHAAADAATSPQPALSATEARIVIESMAGAGAATTISGRLEAPAGTPLWLVPPAGEPGAATLVAVDASGAFQATAPTGAVLASGGGVDGAGTSQPASHLLTITPPPAAPALVLEGPVDDAQVQTTPVWFRFRVDAPGGLRSLSVSDAAGHRRGGVDLAGVRAGGMIGVDVPPGDQVLHFELLDAAGGRSELTRRLHQVPSPSQHPGYRAQALLVALQPSGMGQELRPRDPAWYERSLLHAERFNLVDPEAAGLQARELAWAQAGLVTPTTAVRAGRTAQSRYVLLGTVTRGRDDAECFVRLVNCATGQVVATADAYDRVADDFAAQRFYSTLAARLRQAFPVQQSRLVSHAGRQVLSLGTAEGVCENLRFHVIVEGKPSDDAALIEVVACRAHESDFRWLGAQVVAPALVVSE